MNFSERSLRRLASVRLATVGAFIFLGTNAGAQVVWTNWTSGTAGTAGTAAGTLTIGSDVVNVGYTGQIEFIQTNGAGTNYWNPSAPYISATVPNAPPNPDIIALSLASSRTITFSQPITNPLFAVVSLNGNGYRFNGDFDILSFGAGYWGNGTLTKQNGPGNSYYELDGNGEPHGVIEFQGIFSSISWSALTNENWNGFTIGVRGIAPVVTPEPGTITLMAMGMGGAGLLLHRRRRKSARIIA